MSDYTNARHYMQDTLKESKRIAKRENTEMLTRMRIAYETKNNGNMLIIETKRGKLVFYPSSAIFIDSQRVKRTGMMALLAYLGK